MKVKDLAAQFGVDATSFSNWIVTTGHRYKSGALGGITLEDGQDIEAIVAEFRRMQYANAEQAKANAEVEAAEAAKKQAAIATMLVTSGFNFDGFSITKYSGYISGDDVVQVDRGSQGIFSRATNVGESLMTSLVQIRRNALNELKEAAYALGCNAVIGVDFDYLTLDPETVNSQGGTLYMPYVFGVTANGNAVIIEKNKRVGE
jgi:uncharacterized protein YbjQ (UPF0145 family)